MIAFHKHKIVPWYNTTDKHLKGVTSKHVVFVRNLKDGDIVIDWSSVCWLNDYLTETGTPFNIVF